MITKSPSGALSPYYYKGGYFHGIHYGSYFENKEALLDMMNQEEQFILKSPERRRILMDFYEDSMTDDILERLIQQVAKLNDKIIKLAIATDAKNLKKIKHALKKANSPVYSRCYFCTDMEEGKTWLVSDKG